MGKKKGRGSGTGHGSSKKNRGAGNRGGRGKAGLGKKAKQHKVQAVKKGGHLGEKGFNRPQKTAADTTAINLRDIDQQIDTLVEEGYAEKDGDSYVFDAEEAGYDKVLGVGQLRQDINVKAPAFSDSAKRKIEDHGNEVIVTADEGEGEDEE